MATILKTAAQVRSTMPQANPEQYLNTIAAKIEAAAKAGKTHTQVYEDAKGIYDISRCRSTTDGTLAGTLLKILREAGYSVDIKAANYTDPRETVPASLFITW